MLKISVSKLKLLFFFFLISLFLNPVLAQSKKIILGVHGLGGRGAWFDQIRPLVTEAGIELVTFDLPGFGFNNQKFDSYNKYPIGYVDSYKDWLDYVQAKYEQLKADNPDAQIFIMGNSLGGLIVTNLPNIHPGDCLILSVPGYGGNASTFDLKFTSTVVSKYIVDLLLPGKHQYLALPESKKIYESESVNDKYRISELTPNLLIQTQKLQNQTEKNIQKITVPVLMVSIETDRVVNPEKQKQMFDLIPSEKKVFKSYTNTDHDWMWTPDQAKITKDIIDWVKSN